MAGQEERNKQIRKRLIDLDMSQKELAELLGTDPRYLNAILKGLRSGKKYENQIFEILREKEAQKKKNRERREVIL